ncbi:hypothetical protein [Heyndrickxia sporothermodurans]
MSEYGTMAPSEKPALNRLRIRAKKHGLRIEKARGQQHLNQRGRLHLIESRNNTVFAGIDYELTVAQAAYWIERYIAEQG